MVRTIYLTGILLVAMVNHTVFAEKLPVKLTPQEKDQWCWAATSQAAINYYGVAMTQTEIVTKIKGSPVNQPGQPDEMVKALNLGQCNASQLTVSSATEASIQKEADAFHPATLGYGQKHVITYCGYTKGTGTSVIYHTMDPWPVNKGEWKDVTWAGFKNVASLGNLDLIVKTNRSVVSTDTIKVTAPAAGLVVPQDTTLSITWNDNISENVSIELFDGTTKKLVIQQSTESDGKYEWKIPTTVTPGTNYTIVIASTTKPTTTASSGVFTIQKTSSAVLDNIVLVKHDGIHMGKGNNLFVQVPLAGTYTYRIYSVDGKLVLKNSDNFKKGVNIVPLTTLLVGNKSLIVDVKGMNCSYVKKIVSR